ncbi:MAG: saccharopine dehydrogenase C-terminal domain-containing protein [Bacteroidota bacterium]
MKHILILGAGRSAASLIRYIAAQASEASWHVVVGDIQQALAEEKIAAYDHLEAILFDLSDEVTASKYVAEQDVVISLLPPALHVTVAKLCLQHGVHLLTASYVSEEMQALHEEAQAKGLLFLNEVGLDPGIDHLSAMVLIEDIQAQGGKIEVFKSFTGGLIAPAYDNNPWHYKFTWNPQNVVLAGQGTAVYLAHNQTKLIPYQQLFKRIEPVTIQEYGAFEGYANRNSLKYKDLYNLQEVHTLLRGTLRRAGYCAAWDCFVQLGMTDPHTKMSTASLTRRSFLNTFLPYHPTKSVEEKFCAFFDLQPNDTIFAQMAWLGLFEEEEIVIPQSKATPAQLLQSILASKWVLAPSDKDMIVMQHQFVYTLQNQTRKLYADLVVIGEDTQHTAMAKTVGLPLGITTKLLLEGQIPLRGVHIPTHPTLYKPILANLKMYGIEFKMHEAG